MAGLLRGQMSEILCIGTNDATTITRRAILERAGHTVTPVQDFLEIVKACQAKIFDVAILSHILPIREKQRISASLGQTCPKTKLLELHVGIAPELPDADGHLQVTTSQPAELVKVVDVLA
jgi:CheY-like chemotaxis protein